MLLQLHEMQQVTPKSDQEVIELAKARREAERQESIRFIAKWGAIVAGVVVLALIAPTRSTISLILYAASILAAVLAMSYSPSNFSLKPVGEVGIGDISPDHEQAPDELIVKLITAAEVDSRIDEVLRPWLQSGHPIRIEQFNAVQAFAKVSSKSVSDKENRATLDRKRAAYLQPTPHVVRENNELDDIALPIVVAAAAVILTQDEPVVAHRHDDAAAHTPGYSVVGIPHHNVAYHGDRAPVPRADNDGAECVSRFGETDAATPPYSCAPDHSTSTSTDHSSPSSDHSSSTSPDYSSSSEFSSSSDSSSPSFD